MLKNFDKLKKIKRKKLLKLIFSRLVFLAFLKSILSKLLFYFIGLYLAALIGYNAANQLFTKEFQITDQQKNELVRITFKLKSRIKLLNWMVKKSLSGH